MSRIDETRLERQFNGTINLLIQQEGPTADLIERLIERGVIKVPPVPVVHAPDVDELMEYVETHLEDLRNTLLERGQQYGEDVLVEMGEMGIATLCLIKVRRMLWSIEHGLDPDTRADSWRDLAGYALLAPSMLEWERDNPNEART